MLSPDVNPATKLPHTPAWLRAHGLLPTTTTWTMVGPFRATDTKTAEGWEGGLSGWQVVDGQGRTAAVAPSRDKARARAREFNAENATVTREVPA